MTELFNEADLYPTEKRGPGVKGIVEFKMGDQTEFEGEYVPTTERFFMGVDMNGQPYNRVMGYDEIKGIETEDTAVTVEFTVGKIRMHSIGNGAVKEFAAFVEQQLNK